MIIIAEKLNGSIPSCAKAIAARDEAYLKDIAVKEAAAGAAFIDACASVKDGELETLSWMIEVIQSATDCPISVDSPDVNVCVEAMKLCKKPGLFNSVSGEGNKIDIAFPILASDAYKKWDVMALLCDDTGIPKTAAKRIEVFDAVMEKAAQYGIEESRIHIDPLIEMLCTTDDGEGISMVLEVMRHIKTTHPKVHISGAVSNISFNLPARKLVNQAFVVLAMNAGMDSGVLDPLSQDLMGVIYATEAMLGLDDFCAEYTSAYRDGIFGQKKA
ncbi:MAG: dihydropteroate synthase [Oscillospiraceae bacterium]|jgi:5-methyltetrahydrofolate--homocysteine methyltransferase|nr:dihydropteroate synthase [Oscillospiraceae bacterium]